MRLQATTEHVGESCAAAPRLEGGIALGGQLDFAGLAPPTCFDFGESIAGSNPMRHGEGAAEGCVAGAQAL